MNNSNHHFIPSQDCTYLRQPNWHINSATVRLRTLIGLHRLVYRPEKVCQPKRTNVFGFTCNRIIEATSKLEHTLSTQELFHPMIDVLISADTDDDAKVLLGLLKKMK